MGSGYGLRLDAQTVQECAGGQVRQGLCGGWERPDIGIQPALQPGVPGDGFHRDDHLDPSGEPGPGILHQRAGGRGSEGPKGVVSVRQTAETRRAVCTDLRCPIRAG